MTAPRPPQLEGIDAIYGARLHGLPVIECPPALAALLATAHQRVSGVGVPVEVWDPAGERLDAQAHLERLVDCSRAASTSVVTIATDTAQIEQMEDIAGAVVAWGGLAARR